MNFIFFLNVLKNMSNMILRQKADKIYGLNF